MRRIILVFFGLFFFLNTLAFNNDRNTDEFKLRLVTNKKRGLELHILLYWPSVRGVSRFNIYRKKEGDAIYPETPINSEPIVPMTDCDAIKTLIPEGSKEWESISNTLSPYDPCSMNRIPFTHPKFEVLQTLIKTNWKVAIITGNAYDDRKVVSRSETSLSYGESYLYSICSVDYRGRVLANLDNDVKIKAGFPIAPPPPDFIRASEGDCKILVSWEDVSQASGYNVYREQPLGFGGPRIVNELLVTSRIQFDHRGNYLASDTSWFVGFLDYLRWDDTTGLPTTHMVNNNEIEGPRNRFAYTYRVSSVDFLGNEGNLSSLHIIASPRDETAPMAPSEITATAKEEDSSIEIKWTKVTRDIKNHVELTPVAGYRIYRYEDTNDPNATGIQIGDIVSHPTSGGIYEVKASDSDPILRPLYGVKQYWYRVECIDSEGNVSTLSAAAGAYLKDKTPPAPPSGVRAEGFEEFIKISWELNDEPDIDSYSIYRSFCDYGDWVGPEDKRREGPISGSFLLIGSISHEDARSLASSNNGLPYFEDFTVPSGSPICYAYLVKSVDKSQNMSGRWPIPLEEIEEIVCQRLRDQTPPEPAFISKLLARNNSIVVEWIGAPVQDIKAYQVYRANEQNGSYKWVGGMTVEVPPNPGVELAAPYHPPEGSDIGCNSVPLIAHEGMSSGSIIDSKVVPHKIYWYKVLGIDQVGNESFLDEAVPVSTFTFTKGVLHAPTIISVIQVPEPCGLRISWNPLFDESTIQGFIVFRSDSSSGPYLQIGSLVKSNSILDTSVIKNRKYWYKVMLIDRNENPSPLSEPKAGQVILE